jgi:hypothetical protein
MEMTAKTMSTRACMPVESVYFAIGQLREQGLIEAYQPGLLRPYLIRVRFDQLVEICWELRFRESKLRRRSHRKLGSVRPEKPLPSRFQSLFLDAHGDRRRLPVMDIARVINGQSLPGEPGAHGNNTRVAGQVVQILVWLLNTLYRLVLAGQAHNGEFVIDPETIADQAKLPGVRAVHRVLDILKEARIIRTFRRGGEFRVTFSARRILKIEAQIRARTGKKNVRKLVPAGSEHITILTKRCSPDDAVLVAASDSIDPRVYLREEIVQRLPAGAAIELPFSREKIVIPDGDYADIVRILDNRSWGDLSPDEPGTRLKAQKLIKSWLGHPRYRMTARILRAVLDDLGPETLMFTRLQVYWANNLLTFLNHWPGYLRAYTHDQLQSRAVLRIKNPADPDLPFIYDPADILGMARVTQKAVEHYEQMPLLGQMLEFRFQCAPAGHFEKWSAETGVWYQCNHFVPPYFPFLNPPPGYRFVPDAPDQDDNGINKLAIAALLGGEEAFGVWAKRHLPVLLQYALEYASCYQQWGEKFVQASGVDWDDHFAVMAKARAIIARARAWNAILRVHERVKTRAEAMSKHGEYDPYDGTGWHDTEEMEIIAARAMAA